MSEKFSSLETSLHQKTEISGLSLEKTELIKDIAGDKNFEAFQMIINSGVNKIITQEQKNIVLYILNNIDTGHLKNYFEGEGGFNLVDEVGFEDIINSVDPNIIILIQEYYQEKEQETAQQEQETAQQEQETAQQEQETAQQEQETAQEKEILFLNDFENCYGEIRDKINKIKDNIQDNTFNKYLSDLSILDGFLKQNKIDDNIFEKLIGDYGIKKEDLGNLSNTLKIEHIHSLIIKQIGDYLSQNPEKAVEIFQKLQNDPESYEALYKFLQNSGNSEITQVLKTIPPNPEGFKKGSGRAQAILDKTPYFPEAKSGEEIETHGHIIKFKDKIVDTQDIPPRTYITGPNGYRIETRTISKEILDIRAAFTKERIKIENQISPKEKLLEQYNQNIQGKDLNKYELQLQDLEQKQPKSFDDEIKILELKDEIENIKETIKNRNKLQTEINTLINEGNKKENQFLEYYSKSVGKESGNIEKTDIQAKKTLKFLQSIGFTHIPYSDFLKIQAIINVSPSYYGFSKPLDLNKGFSYEHNSTENNKEECINFFNKLLPESHQVNIGMEKSGNIGDQFKRENFKLNLIGSNNLLNDFGNINMNYFHSKFR